VLARDPDIVARFFNEARAIHMIAHENIVEILDFGQTPTDSRTSSWSTCRASR
jgi:hypothetical protein